MKQTYRLTILLLAMMQFSNLHAQWDCCSPDPFFAPGSPYFVIATGGPGKEDDVSCSCLSAENGGYWIAFSATTSGTFEMMIEPNSQPAPNFDFALWVDNCPCGGGGTSPPISAISCNNVGGTGPTGIADKPEVTFGVPATTQWSETVFLNAGRNYYLLVSDMTSGSAGFTITTAGTASLGALIPEDFGLIIAGPPTVCPGGEAVFTATSQASQLPTYYGWEVSQVSPYGYYYEVATGTQPFVAIDEFPYPGTYEVCVTISNEEIGCNESAPVCTTIDVVSLPNPAGFESGFVCTNNVYVAANGEAFYFGGTFELYYQSWQGCDSIVELTLTQYVSPYVIINKTVCEGNCVEFNGQTVCDPGFYEEILPSYRGCDSTTVLNLIALPIKTIITGGGTIDCITTSLTLNSNTSVYANNPQYRWRKGNVVVGTNPSLVVTSGGTYSLTIKSNIGLDTCMDVATIIIGQNTEQPQNVVATGGTINCYSSQVTLTGSSSTPNVTYAWTGPNGYTSNLQSPTVFTPGTYTLKVTGTNGCTKTASAVVTENKTLPDAMANANGTLNCNATVVLVNGTGSSIGSQYSYLWTTTNGNISGDPTTLSPGVNAPGTYLLTVTNTINGCTKTASTVVVQRPALTATIASSSNVSCFGGQNGAASITVNGGDGNYSIVWSNGATTNSVSGLGAGSYNVIVTDGDGCTSSQNLTLTQPDLLLANASATGQTQMGVNNGTASANPSGGVPNYAYAWTNENGNNIGNSSNLTGLAPGNYTVVVTDGNGCTALQTITVSEVSCLVKATVEQTNVSCFGLSDGSATINLESATPPYAYNWSNGANTQTASGLAAGTYFVSSTDAFGCEVVTTVVIEAPQTLDANVATTPLTSYNSNDGTASASPNGGTAPFSYLWNNGATVESIANLAPGTYSVVVTDANGCSDEQTISIEPYDCGFFASAVATNISCNGLTDGTATASLTGGVAPFDYLWSNGETTASINGLTAGVYTVSINDEIGCPATADVTVIEPAALGVDVVNMVEASCASSNGVLGINATGGTPGYTLLWENGETTATISGLAAGIYNVVVTDANNCVDNFDVVLGTDDENPPVVLTQNITIVLGANGTASTTPNAVDNGSTDNCAISNYALSQTDFDCSDLGDNNVSLTVTDVGNNSVSADAVVTVVDNTPPVLSLQNTTLVIGAGGTITLTPLQIDNGSTDNCAITNWTFSQTSFGCDDVGPNDVTVTATDASGNIATGTIVVTIQETTPPTINCPASFTLAGCDAIGQFDVTATDNCVGAVVLTQTAGPASGSTFPAGTTTVSFTATDVSGNNTNCSFTVTVSPTLSVTTSVTNVDCHGDDTGSATATPNGGLAPFNYIWSNGATTATTSNLTIGSYTVSVTDAGGCTSVQTVSISEPPLLVTALVSITNATNGQANGEIDVNVTGGVSPYSYNWLNSAGGSVGNTQDIEGLAPGTYTLSVMDANGCVSLSGFTIQNSTGTDETDLDSHVMLYPNPTSGKVMLELVGLPNIASVQVSAFDVTGRSVLQQSSASSKQLLDFSALPGGVYMLKIVIGGEMLTKRLVVSK